MKKLIMLLIVCTLFIACSLKEDNPLHNKKAPSVIISDNWSVTQRSGVLVVSWNPLDMMDCDGYYIYRSLSHSGQYVRLIDNPTNVNGPGIPNSAVEELEFEDHDVISGIYYYYKISGYRIYSEGVLEGSISEPKSGRM